MKLIFVKIAVRERMFGQIDLRAIQQHYDLLLPDNFI